MKTLKEILDTLAEAKDRMDKKDPCWNGYEMIGTKKKNGKTVPNCVPKNEDAKLDEAKGDLTYKPEHAKWGVVPKSSKEFVKFFPKNKEADARAHAEKTGGTLKKIDQAGRAMKEDAERIDESLKTHYQNGYDAQKKGKTRQDNPHREGSPAASMWAKGWEHASDKREPQKFANEEVESADLNALFTEAMKAGEETSSKKVIKKGEKLSGKQEPVKLHPEVKNKN